MLDQVLRAIAEPNRREILKLLREKELSAGEIASSFDVTRPAISQHLQVLHAAGLVGVRKVGTMRLYHLKAEGTSELLQLLNSFWDDKLDLLKKAVEGEEYRKDRNEH